MNILYSGKKFPPVLPFTCNRTLSRRDFLKYTGAATGLCFTNRLLWHPFLAYANQRPKVVSVYDSNATNYDYSTGFYWECVNQEIVGNMMKRGIMALTGKSNVAEAWKSLIPYQPGESVLIKLNFNSSSNCAIGYSNKIEPLAETANAIIDGLLSIGVPGDRIWITDPSRRVSDRFRDGITNPDIQYYSYLTCSGPNYHAVDYVEPDSPYASVASCPAGEKILPSQIFVEADHLINVPILKSHGNYVTLALKNHYGSVLFEHYDRSGMHAFFNEGLTTAGCDLNKTNILADINNNPHIKYKTRLIVGDGLFGNANKSWAETERWKIFGDDDPNLLFFGTVAVSSVMSDYIMAERGWQDHQQLHAAASLGLGVHDHWDAYETKNYSAIDYIALDLNRPKTTRLDVDQIIRDFKSGASGETAVKDTIIRYIEGI